MTHIQQMRQFQCRFKMSPEKMIELVMSGKDSDFCQELCSAFWNGFPMENLRPLLVSTDPEILSLGSYIIYELGAKARCLLDDIVPHLDNEDAEIRANAIIALGECATKFDKSAIGKIIEMLDDPDSFVQRIAMRFVQSCDRGMLNVGIFQAAKMNPGTVFEELPGYLGETFFHIYQPVPISAEILENLLSHESPVAKRFGVGLATRPRLIVDESFIDLAAQIEEEECCNIVAWARERPCLIYAETMKLQF
ncbi:MAG: hypothetical protein GY952_14290 [Rhodobacteraceae bacterium]|nr:hypothetical protein [Paracoccaceae bacterium]